MPTSRSALPSFWVDTSISLSAERQVHPPRPPQAPTAARAERSTPAGGRRRRLRLDHAGLEPGQVPVRGLADDGDGALGLLADLEDLDPRRGAAGGPRPASGMPADPRWAPSPTGR